LLIRAVSVIVAESTVLKTKGSDWEASVVGLVGTGVLAPRLVRAAAVDAPREVLVAVAGIHGVGTAALAVDARLSASRRNGYCILGVTRELWSPV
jgi:hypothetical protein